MLKYLYSTALTKKSPEGGASSSHGVRGISLSYENIFPVANLGITEYQNVIFFKSFIGGGVKFIILTNYILYLRVYLG